MFSSVFSKLFLATNHNSQQHNTVIKGPFGFTISIIQFSVSITHNSKMVGLIAKRLFGKR